MSVANLVLQYVKALAWPLVVVLAVLIFRPEVRSLLRRMRSLAGAGFNAEFGEEVRTALDAAKEAVQQERQEPDENAAQQQPRPDESTKSTFDMLREIADLSPEAAVQNAFNLVETKMRSILEGFEPPQPGIVRRRAALELVTDLENLGLSDFAATTINSLRLLRNQAAHTVKPISQRAARDYIDSAMLVLELLDRFERDHRAEAAQHSPGRTPGATTR